jgi:SAM-dependent methyltransferase
MSRDLGQKASDPSDGHGPERILELAFAFRKAKALMSAVELDVFTVLDEGPVECDALVKRLGIHPRGAQAYLAVLVANKLIERDPSGRFRNAVDCDRYLNRRSSDYIGDLVEHLDRRMYHIWARLAAGLRSGSPQSGSLGDGGYQALYANPAEFTQFLRGMTAGSRLPARTLAKWFGWDRYGTFFDIGTAQGCVPAEIANAHPHLAGGGFDLPEIRDAFCEYVDTVGLGKRLTFHAGNFLQDELPGADVLVMGRILHNWGLPTKKMLLQKAHRALPPGGALIVYDPMLDEESPSIQALFADLTMLLETQEGFEYTLADCRQWMAEAGFSGIQVMQLDPGHTAMVGYKER